MAKIGRTKGWRYASVVNFPAKNILAFLTKDVRNGVLGGGVKWHLLIDGIGGDNLNFYWYRSPLLWPDKKWIGWISLSFAVALLIAWGWLEFGSVVSKFSAKHQTFVSYAAVSIIGAMIACGVWYATFQRFKSKMEVPGVSQQPNVPLPEFALSEGTCPACTCRFKKKRQNIVRSKQFEKMEPKDLSAVALVLAAKIRRLKQECDDTSNEAEDKYFGKIRPDAPAEENQRMMQEINKVALERMYRCRQSYDNKYRTDAIMVREAMLDRLPGMLHDKWGRWELSRYG